MLIIFAALCMALPVEAWVVAGARGVAVGRVGFGAGCYHGAYYHPAYGGAVAYGGAAVWGHSSGVAYGAYGGSASWSHGSGTATGRYGGTASWSGGSGSYHGAYGGSATWHR
jgi:hypothetical protein